MGDKPDHDHTTPCPSYATCLYQRLLRLMRPPPPPFGLHPELALRGLHRGRIGLANIANTTWDASLHVSAGTLSDSDNVHYQIATRPSLGSSPPGPPRSKPTSATPPPPCAITAVGTSSALHRGGFYLHPTPSSSALLQPATSCPQTMLINKGVNDRSRDLVLGPADQPASQLRYNGPSPLNCAAVAIPSMLPPRSSILYSCTHSPDKRRWPPNPRTPSRPAQGSNPPAQYAISRTAEPFPSTLRQTSSHTPSPKHGRTGSNHRCDPLA
jgi:hypothetical protein